MSSPTLDSEALAGSPRGRRRWLAATLLVALLLTAAWATLDLGLAARTGLAYAVYPPDTGFDGEPLAQGVVGRPALRGPGVGPDDERRLTRGAGRRAVRWSGLWHVASSGPHEIFVAGSGEIVVRLDGELVVHHADPSGSPASGTVQLEEGFHRLVVRFQRSHRQPWLTVHWAPLGEGPRPFDPGTLLPQRADEGRYVWNRWARRLGWASVALWALVALVVAAPRIRPGMARLSTVATRFRAASDAVTVVALAGSGLFVATTLLQHELARLIGPRATFFLNLQSEGSLAAWWSGILLLLAALYAVDAGAAADDPGGDVGAAGKSARLGWGCLALVLAALSADEIGAFHEHMGELVGWGTWWSMAPFALALVGLLGVGLAALWRVRPLRRVTLALAAGFGVLAVGPPVLEVLEHGRDWGIAGAWWHPYNLRGTVEESSELLGMLILLHACALGRRRLLAGSGQVPDRASGPEAATVRGPLLVLGWPLAAGTALLSPLLPPEMAPGAWLASAFFLLVAARAWFHRGEVAGCRSLAAVALAASAVGTLFPLWTSVWLVLSIVLTLAWVDARLRRDRPPAAWYPALSLGLGPAPWLAAPAWEAAVVEALPAWLGLTALLLAPRSRS